MNIVSIPRLLEALLEHQLLDDGPWHEAAAALAPDSPDDQVADWLLQRGLVTEFQAEFLRGGHLSQLVMGPYRLLDRIGEGGLCEVFLARQVPAGRLVALKVLLPAWQDNAKAREQLDQEMETAARLRHPRFLQALDVVPGRPYFAMEYVAGVDLQRVARQFGRLPLHQACDYVHQAALGLQYAFEQGLVHRDVKPANLIVSFAGEQVYVLDIGLARLEWDFHGQAAAREEGEALLMGTPDYVAPEQALEPARADVRADIYSLGCTLFHLLTGRPPFSDGTLQQKLLHHQSTPPPSLRGRCPEATPLIDRVVQKMLAKLPQERYQTPAAVALALSPFCRQAAPRVSLEELRPIRASGTRAAPASEPAPKTLSSATALDETAGPLPLPLLLPEPPLEEPLAQVPLPEPEPAPVPPPAPAPRPVVQQAPPAPRLDGRERRREPRRGGHLVPVQVSRDPEGKEPLRGWVLDRSPGGLGLMIEEALEPESTAYVRPAVETFGPRWLAVRIAFCRPQRMRWQVGCQFLERPSWGDLRFFG